MENYSKIAWILGHQILDRANKTHSIRIEKYPELVPCILSKLWNSLSPPESCIVEFSKANITMHEQRESIAWIESSFWFQIRKKNAIIGKMCFRFDWIEQRKLIDPNVLRIFDSSDEQNGTWKKLCSNKNYNHKFNGCFE